MDTWWLLVIYAMAYVSILSEFMFGSIPEVLVEFVRGFGISSEPKQLHLT